MSPNRHQHCLQTERSDIPHDPRHLGVPSGASKRICKPMVHLAQTLHLSYTDTNTISNGTSSANHAPIFHRHKQCLQIERSEIPHDPRHLGVQSGALKMIFEPMVRSKQTVHLSYVKISTISKWTETNLHLILLTSEHHWVRPKRFLSLWYIWRQPCSYLIWTQTISKWTETRFHMTTSPRSSIGCIQNDFRANVTFGAKRAPILHQD